MFIVKKIYCSETTENVQAHYRKTIGKMKNINLIGFIIIDLLAKLCRLNRKKWLSSIFKHSSGILYVANDNN